MSQTKSHRLHSAFVDGMPGIGEDRGGGLIALHIAKGLHGASPIGPDLAARMLIDVEVSA